MKKTFKAKQLFLTYPQCPLPREELMEHIQTSLQAKDVKEVVIGQETHKDGNLHLHAYVRLGAAYIAKGAHTKL